MNRRLYIVIGVVVLLGAAVIAFFLFDTAGGPTLPDDEMRSLLAVSADDHTMGTPTAPVTIIEYFAPSCPVCAHFDAEVFPLVKTNYIDTGKVYYVFRVYQLRPADGAAEAIARCLPKEYYFQFIQLLFRNQAEWDPEYGITDVHGALQRMGRIAGLSNEKVDSCIQDADVQKKINKLSEDAVTRLGITGTPTLFINGVKQSSGILPWTELKPLIDAELAKHAK